MNAYLLVIFAAAAGASVATSRHAYATLLYSNNYELSVRVLGASLVAVGAGETARVCLYTSHVSAAVVRRLAGDGWQMASVEHIDMPQSLAPARLRYVYTKLAVWTFDTLGFSKVVFLDSDTLVVRPIDALFECGPRFCASMRHESYHNAGVLVLATDSNVYADMMQRLLNEPARRDAEQGFLNEFFADVHGASLFNESNGGSRPPTAASGTGAGTGAGADGIQRLSFSYNADPLLYSIAGNRWRMPGEEGRAGPFVLHYIGDHAKPWQWTSYLLFAACWPWDETRQAAGLGAPLAQPVLVVAACWLACALVARSATAGRGIITRPTNRPFATALLIHALALVLGFFLVPENAPPYHGCVELSALYGAIFFVAWHLRMPECTRTLGARASAVEAISLLVLLAALTAWRSGSFFVKIGVLCAALVSYTHVAVGVAREAVDSGNVWPPRPAEATASDGAMQKENV